MDPKTRWVYPVTNRTGGLGVGNGGLPANGADLPGLRQPRGNSCVPEPVTWAERGCCRLLFRIGPAADCLVGERTLQLQSPRWGSNPRPAVYKTAALATELLGRDFRG